MIAGSWEITIKPGEYVNQGAAPAKIAGLPELIDPGDLSPYLSKDKKTMVLFEKTSCPYCLTFESRFINLAKERSEDFHFLRIKLDDPRNPLWEKYDVIAVPTVILFSESQITARADSILALGLSKRKWAEFCDRL
jgi:thiol-disulfide isomerase/thioredoxin